MDHKFIKSDNFKIHYTVVGSGDGIVFIHGWIFNHSFWKVQAKYFSNAGYKVVLPDVRGHGMSSTVRGKENYTIEKMSDDIEKIIYREKVKFIVGHSMGGLIAMELARRGLGEKITIVSASHERPFLTNFFPRQLMVDFFGAMSPDVRKTRFRDLYSKRSLLEIVMWLEARKNINRDVFIGSFEGILDYDINPEKIRKKTLLISGWFDYLYMPFQVKRTHKRIENSKLVLLPTLHGLPVESWKFNDILLKFIEKPS